MLLPDAAQPEVVCRNTDVFLGLDRSAAAAENQFSSMTNLSAYRYPCLAARPARGIGGALTAPQAIAARDGLCIAANGSVTLNGAPVPNLTLTPGPKQLVPMGAYELIFPDKLWFNTQNLSESGSMEASVTVTGAVTASLCTASGIPLTPPVGANAPANPENGQLWLDTSSEPHVLRVWSADSALWSAEPTTWVLLSATGIGTGFSARDGVTVSGLTGSAACLNGAAVLAAALPNALILPGLLDEAVTQAGGVTVTRTVPELDFVTECGNRLWGCRYGLVDGVPVNEIYACRLGDFKNWSAFEGLSTDSYAASRGADGAFTGAITYRGQPLFFREDGFERVLPSESGAHRIVFERCRGVRSGCARSLCQVGESLFWLSRDGVCLYSGASPVLVSERLGAERWSDARGGALGSRYYLSVREADGSPALYCYDGPRGLWHREDGALALGFAAADGDLYFLDENDGRLKTVLGSAGEPERAFGWEAVTGLLGAQTREAGWLSRILLRGSLEPGAALEISAEYDSDGVFRPLGSVTGSPEALRCFRLPLLPRRCDHLRLRLRGRGGFTLRSFSCLLERGSDL